MGTLFLRKGKRTLLRLPRGAGVLPLLRGNEEKAIPLRLKLVDSIRIVEFFCWVTFVNKLGAVRGLRCSGFPCGRQSVVAGGSCQDPEQEE